MTKYTLKSCFLFISMLVFGANSFAEDFTFFDSKTQLSIVYDRKAPALDSIAAHLLRDDINRVTGYLPTIFNDLSKATGNVIIIGNISSTLIRKVLSSTSQTARALNGKWECYGLKLVNKPVKNVDKALIIAGSDTRGTAYGVFSISERIGVTPWYWWADVAVNKQGTLKLDIKDLVSLPPSVKYRGIFLNDEDWGLQPWAAKTFEPETGDIGPKTYSKIFELLLRLKANLIWPAMHPSTKAFYHYPGNKDVAADYAIVVGSSHAEPMLRNNVSEWNKSMGDFNFLTNTSKIREYWESRVKESKSNDAIYTLGMRGVHDSGMEGVKSVKEAVPLLEKIIAEQRGMLRTHINSNVGVIPQVFTVYKEVLEIYDNNIRLPDDVTVVWPDDNYGYIQRLNADKEINRTGGSGVYYHASYWGRPHDYLWLSSTHPALIREEMMKAWEMKSDRLWVLNVGDIKPLEYNIQLFMDMAYNAEPFKRSEYSSLHLENWASTVFGRTNAQAISHVLWNYYNLAFERRPEFMGWSQTEPTTETNYSEYNHFYYGDEAQRRIDSYQNLENEVSKLREAIPEKDADAFYQLVYYPVKGASLINKKFLYRDKAYLYSEQNRSSAVEYATLSNQAYADIVKETDYYNNQLSKGKWKHMMSMIPRNLPVYKEPVLPATKINRSGTWSIAPEGFEKPESSAKTSVNQVFSLPAFNPATDGSYFIDIFLSDEKTLTWTATYDNWIRLSQSAGTLSPLDGKRQSRLWVSVDWNKLNQNGRQNGKIRFSGNGKSIDVNVGANTAISLGLAGFKGFIEKNGYVSISSTGFSRKSERQGREWAMIDGLGSLGKSLMAIPLKPESIISAPESIKAKAPFVEYDFFTFTSATPSVNVFTLPTHPLNAEFSMRFALSIDDGPVRIVDFKTAGRSEEWKQNVLRNAAIKKIETQAIEPGKHTLRIYMIDPAVLVDRITIDLGGLKSAYSPIPLTSFK